MPVSSSSNSLECFFLNVASILHPLIELIELQTISTKFNGEQLIDLKVAKKTLEILAALLRATELTAKAAKLKLLERIEGAKKKVEVKEDTEILAEALKVKVPAQVAANRRSKEVVTAGDSAVDSISILQSKSAELLDIITEV
jgi:hypothetical protein